MPHCHRSTIFIFLFITVPNGKKSFFVHVLQHYLFISFSTRFVLIVYIHISAALRFLFHTTVLKSMSRTSTLHTKVYTKNFFLVSESAYLRLSSVRFAVIILRSTFVLVRVTNRERSCFRGSTTLLFVWRPYYQLWY